MRLNVTIRLILKQYHQAFPNTATADCWREEREREREISRTSATWELSHECRTRWRNQTDELTSCRQCGLMGIGRTTRCPIIYVIYTCHCWLAFTLQKLSFCRQKKSFAVFSTSELQICLRQPRSVAGSKLCTEIFLFNHHWLGCLVRGTEALACCTQKWLMTYQWRMRSAVCQLQRSTAD